MHLTIAGLPDNTSEQEVQLLLEEYGCQVIELKILSSEFHNRRSAIVTIDSDRLGIESLAKHINGHYWHGNRLRAGAFLFGDK